MGSQRVWCDWAVTFTCNFWITEKAREFQKNICFIDYAKAFDYVDHNKLWKILKEMEYQTTLPASWEIKKQQLELDMEQWTGSKLGNEYVKVHTVNLFNLYAQYIMQNAGLDEAQAGVKIAGRSNNNLRYADNTTSMAESQEE